ncbi:NifB/NifX family molybdenum-iron cluster-binding protein [Cellulosilyticum sp. WCF-2]|uniref:NifB/NifX family molybdenum-iron cluster-binding protein n=1 Tax=Cellulosilyticum sp. WCF-2 TaxID=2497860 RepID=UPI000F8C915C|nr:NifB/NifX family molybdenum-iron cluster-binding protein [Cellulosilyticum sp. WCF-2]QEH67785.1 dinitrogenase iron-molybdenum cofactor biosynthesis protein [Cellulosilyticum sp. WCF-2]
MKIAVPTENNHIYGHFGKAKLFTVYEVTENASIHQTALNTEGSGHGALVAALKEEKVDTLLCGGIGGPAKSGLEKEGIKVISGLCGEVEQLVFAYLQGKLPESGGVTCNHHHGEEHDCNHHEDEHDCHCH